MSSDGLMIAVVEIGSLVMGLVCLAVGLARTGTLALISRLQTTPVHRIRDGVVELKGRVTHLDAQQGLTSPLTGKTCVYYEVHVKTLRSEVRWNSWVLLKRVRQSLPFCIEDGTGTVLVSNPEQANWNVALSLDWDSATGQAMSSQIAGFLRENGIKTTNMLGFPRRFRVVERVLEQGESVFIVGSVPKANAWQAQGAKDVQCAIGKFRPANVLYISDKSEARIQLELLGQAVLLLLIGLALLGLSLGYYYHYFSVR